MSQGQFTHDVFVSYSHKDRQWVREELIPRLKTAGLKVLIDEDDFEIGRPSVKNMVRAVEQSRHVVAVLTPDWVASQWTDFESTLSLTLRGDDRRFWPIMLADCMPPNEIAILTYVDFIKPEKRVEGMAKLLAQLGVSQQRLQEAAAKSASEGLGALIQLMRSPKVREACGDFKEILEETREQIAVLSRYKRLHDLFQRAEGAYELVQRQKDSISDDPMSWLRATMDAQTFAVAMQALLDFTQHNFPESETLWCTKLELSHKRLAQALEQRNLPLLHSAIQLFHQVNGQVPHQLNIRLVVAADKLPLDKLIERLEHVSMQLKRLQLEGQAAERVESFQAGVEGLKTLDVSLREAIDHHNRLQEIDNERRLYDIAQSGAVDQITDGWPVLKAMIDDFIHDESVGAGQARWLGQLRQVYVPLNQCCFSDPGGRSEAAQTIPFLFARFSGVIVLGFNQVDTDLLRLCDQLAQWGEQVGRLLRSLENGDDH